MLHRFCCFLLPLLVLAGSNLAVAQETATPDSVMIQETEAVPEVNKDLQRCRENLNLLNGHLPLMKTLMAQSANNREERNLMRLEVVDRLTAMRELLTDTSNRLAKLDTLGGQADSVRTATAVFVRELLDLEMLGFERVTANVEKLRSRRNENEGEDLAEIESLLALEIDLQISVVEWIQDTAQLHDDLGMDAGWSWPAFDEALRQLGTQIDGHLQVATKERKRLQTQLKAAEIASAEASVVAELRLRIQALVQRIDGNVAGLRRLVRLFESRGIEASAYRQVLIESTGEVSEGILDPEVLRSLAIKGWDSLVSWLSETGPARLVQFLILLGFVVLFRLLARGLWWLYNLTRRSSGSRLAQDMAGRMVRPTGTLIGVFTGLWVMGADPTTLLTGLGVASVIIGLALQDTLGNLAAGFFILLYRPYDVDDAIKAGGEVGLVKAMGMANTTIVTFDNRRLYVPNRKIWSDVIENRSMEKRRRVATTLRISYDDDLDRALGVVRDFLAQHELVMDDPAPTVFVSELGPSWIEISVWPSALIENWWALTICLPQDLLNLLRSEGIHMPYAQQEIRLRPMAFDKDEE